MASKRMIKQLNNAVTNLTREIERRENAPETDYSLAYPEQVAKHHAEVVYVLNAAKGMLDEAKAGHPDSYITLRPIWPRVQERSGTPFSW